MFRCQLANSPLFAAWSNQMDLALIFQFNKHLENASHMKFCIVLYTQSGYMKSWKSKILNVHSFVNLCIFKYYCNLEQQKTEFSTKNSSHSQTYKCPFVCKWQEFQRQLLHGIDTREIHLVKKILTEYDCTGLYVDCTIWTEIHLLWGKPWWVKQTGFLQRSLVPCAIWFFSSLCLRAFHVDFLSATSRFMYN